MRNTELEYWFNISRPKFYSYLAGPFVVGLAAGAHSITQIPTLINGILLFFFLVPANFFLYGINDLFDTETDQINPKKRSHEQLLHTSAHRVLRIILISVLLISLVLSFLMPFLPRILLWIFLLLSVGYSAPPIRFKARPWFDAYSNVLYIIPGLVGYTLVTNELPPLSVIILGWCWAAGMHLLSAIPDIVPDSRARITTTAVWLGHQPSLVVVGINWLVFASLTFLHLGLVGIISFVYPAIICWLLFQPPAVIKKVYWWFPAINTSIGALAFFYFFLPLFL